MLLLRLQRCRRTRGLRHRSGCRSYRHQYGRGVIPHTGCLPFGRWWRCRLLTTRSIVVPLPSTCKRHTGADTSCGCSRTPAHPSFQRYSGSGEEQEDRTHLLQVVMVQLQMRAAQHAILLRIVTVSQTSRPVAVLMQMSKTETGLTWRFVSSSETRLRQQCDPAMLSMLPTRVSVAGAQMRARVLVQLLVSVLMMMLTHCFAGWRKASLRLRRQLRILMVVVVVLAADQL